MIPIRDAFRRIGKERGFKLIEDAAQAWGADQIFDELYRQIGLTDTEHQVIG